MSALIDHLDTASPIVRAMIGLLPYCPPPVILPPASGLPGGCLHLPAARLVVVGAAGCTDRAWGDAEAIGRRLGSDVVIVGAARDDGGPAVRYDVLFVEGDRVELVPDLLFWTLPARMPALVPAMGKGPAVMLGRASLIPVETLPFHDAGERGAGIARGMAGQRPPLARTRRREVEGEIR